MIAGPKELPRLAKGLGRATGRAAGFVHRARSQASDFANKNDLNELHKDLQMTLGQLNTIKAELQSGILKPGPLAQTLIRATELADKSITAAETAANHLHTTTHTNSASPQQRAIDPSISSSFNEQHKSSAPIDISSHIASSSSTSRNSQSVNTATEDPVFIQWAQSHNRIPVSAVVAGLVPDRSGSLPSGSEIMMDALEEERVATEALRFFEQQQNQQTMQGSELDGASKNKER